MRKNLLLGLAALAAVTLSSCQKDQVVNQVEEQDAIEFSTYVGRDVTTKATSITDVKSGFGVFAYHHSGNFVGEDLGGDSESMLNFMFNQEVFHNPSGWTYSPTKYWPAAGKLSFFAYAPFSGDISAPNIITNIPTDNTTTGFPKFKFSVTNIVSNQIDLLYASPITDVTSSTVDDAISTNGNLINFGFNHALSRIGFSATTGSGQTATISQVKLSGNFYINGTISLNDGNFIDLNSDAQDYTLNYSNHNVVTGGTEPIVADEGYIMIIPKNFDAENVTVTVSYTIEDVLGNTKNYASQGTITNPVFVKGKAYNINLILNPNSPIIFGDPIITEWPAEESITPSIIH